MDNNAHDLVITPKRLGKICMDSFCPRCYWYLIQQRFHPPFDFFGGAIFKNMEQAQMAIVGQMLEEDKKLPEEFFPFCDAVSRVEFPRDWRKFQCRLASGVLLRGEPDDIYNVADGSIAVVDFKTAQPKNGEDPFLPCYQCQIIGYAFIAEFGLKLGEVSKGGLLYWAAQNERVVSDPSSFYNKKKLIMPFVPSVHAFEIDYSFLDAPLAEAIRLWKAPTPPDGAAECGDCKKLSALMAIEAEVEQLLAQRDEQVLARSANHRWVRDWVLKRRYDLSSGRASALAELRGATSELNFAEDGMIANWYN